MNDESYKKEKMPTSIKLEREMLEKIKEDAKRERRSITGQIEYMISQYYEIKKRVN